MKQYLKFDHSRINNYSLQHHFLTIFKKIELIFFIVLSLIFLTVSRTNPDFKNNFSYFFIDISTPFINAVSFPFNLTINLLINFQDLANAKKENVVLKEENEKMKQLLINIINIKDENQELKNILKFVIPRSLNYKMVNITGRAHGSFNQQLFIEAREDAQLKDGSVVIGNVGMIGRVFEARGNRSRLLLPTYARSHIPIIASKSRARGVLRSEEHTSE